MRYYKKIEIDYYDEIVADTLSYLQNQKPDIYNKTISASFFILDLDEFKKYCPKLDMGFSRYNLVCNFAVAFVMNKTSDVQIHIDSGKTEARINIPIINTENTFTRFYTGGSYKKHNNSKTNVTAKVLSNIQNLKLVDSVEIIQPTVLRVNEPHNVLKNNDKFPRITLSLGFDIDPIFLLED